MVGEEDLQILRREFGFYLGDDSNISPTLEYINESQGKAIRARLFLNFCRLFNCGEEEKFKIAVAIEYIHFASLLHDDIIDESDSRRGNQAMHKKWDIKTAILMGDFLYSRAFELIGRSCPHLSEIFAHAANRLSISELDQLGAIQDLDILRDENKCLKVMQEKTAILFAVTCEAAAILGEGRDMGDSRSSNRAAAFNYGMNIGTAFQIMDDCLDYGAESVNTGKPRMQDLAKGKITLPLVYLYGLSDDSTKKKISSLIQIPEEEKTSDELHSIEIIMRESGAYDRVLAKASSYIDAAVKELSRMDIEKSQEEWRKKLVCIAESINKQRF